MKKTMLLLALLSSFNLGYADDGAHKHHHKHSHEQKAQEEGIHPKRISKTLPA